MQLGIQMKGCRLDKNMNQERNVGRNKLMREKVERMKRKNGINTGMMQERRLRFLPHL